MKNLLILGLLLISILIYCLVKDNLKEALSLNTLSNIDLDSYTKDRCEWQKKLKTKMTTTTCALDDRCDHVRLGKVRKVEMGLDGKIKVNEEDNIKCEGFSNNTKKTATETQVARCDKITKCEDMGRNCGYCDDTNPPYGLGRFMWTTRWWRGPGTESPINEIAQRGKPCPKNKWTQSVNMCKKQRLQKLCGLIKSCDDFEKYSELIDEGVCGFCPTRGKAVPIRKVGQRNVPLYLPEDTCEGGPELAKYGTLNAKQCTKFMSENPCVRPQYWTGTPDHSGECYKKLYKKAGGRDSKKDENWWRGGNSYWRRNSFDVTRNDLRLGNNAPNDFFRHYAPIPWIIKYFKNKASEINDRCYKAANNSWSWLTGYSLDPCRHQDEKNVPNQYCQAIRWNSLDQTIAGHARRALNTRLNDACEGFSSGIESFSGIEGFSGKEGFRNGIDWLRRNMPAVLDRIEAQKWYDGKMHESKRKANIGGQTWKNFLKEIEGVMYSGKTYQMRVYATLLLKGEGHKPPPPPPLKKGDYVEFKLREHIFRGILWEKKGPNCKVMWDYYKNTSTNREHFRGPSYGVCYNTKEKLKGRFREGHCIEGVKGNAYKDRGNTCRGKSGIDHQSCRKPYGVRVKSKNFQKSLFGYPQYPSVRAKYDPGTNLGSYPRGTIKDVFLRTLKRCKPSSEGCSSTDYNCEDAMVIANKIYKKPQDCAFSMSGYSRCSRKCDGGWQYRNYKTILPAKGPDADRCPIGPNQKGYTTTFAWRRCNTNPCHENKYRKIKMRWCGYGGDSKNCVDPAGVFKHQQACVGVGARGRGEYSGYSGRARGTSGDEIQRGSCQDGGVSRHWRDSAGEHLKDGAYFYLTPIHNKPDVYTFKYYSPQPWSKVRQNARRAGLKETRRGHEGLCLHPNVNTVEVADGRVTGSTYRGRSYKFRWGRDQGWVRGPTNARNAGAGWKGGSCSWRPPRGFGQMYGSWIRWNRYGLNVTHVAKYGNNSNILYVRDGRYGKMCRANDRGQYIWGSGRYVDVRKPWWWGGGYWTPNSPRQLIHWYERGRYAGSGYRFRKGYRHNCNYGARFHKGQEWDGLGGLGSCSSPYAQLKMEKTGTGNFRLKREAFSNFNNNEKEDDKVENVEDKEVEEVDKVEEVEEVEEDESSTSIWDYIYDFFTDKKACGYTKKNGNLKEGLHWVTIGSKRGHTPGRGYYMGEPARGYADATHDRLYANDKGSVHKIHCDSSWRAERRVGIYKCRGGSKNGKEYPFKTQAAQCLDKEALVESGFRDEDLHCQTDCEPSGGKCVGPYYRLAYFKVKADPFHATVHARNHRWWWSNAKSILGNKSNARTGQVIGRADWAHWWNRARPIPNIRTEQVKVQFFGRDQGWGNSTAWIRLILWSGRRVVYNADVGGRGCNWNRNHRCVSRNWSWNNQTIPYTEFISRRPERITRALILVREMGSGHQAWVKHASITFNPGAKFKGSRSLGEYQYVGRPGECYGAEQLIYANKYQNPGSWAQKVARCANACRGRRLGFHGESKGFLVHAGGGYYRGRCFCEPQDSTTCRWANNIYRRFDFG